MNKIFNSKNFHHYEIENPHIQHRHSVNVCCSMVGNSVLGPYFLDGNWNGGRYLQCMQEDFQAVLEDLPLTVIQGMSTGRVLFPKFWTTVGLTSGLEIVVPRIIIFLAPYNCCIAWSPGSPDLNPLDYFLWGYMKNIVYTVPSNNSEELLLQQPSTIYTLMSVQTPLRILVEECNYVFIKMAVIWNICNN